MADPVIGFMIDRFCTYVEKNLVSGFFGFEDECRKMKDSLSYLKPWLIDLQAPKNQNRNNSEFAKATVVKVRELILEADDILVDCQILEDYQKEHNTWNIYGKFNKTRFRHQTKGRLAEINAEMEKTIKTYCLPSMIDKISVHQGNDDFATNSRWTSSILNKSETVGLIKDLKQIKDWILAKNNELKRVAIVGMGGLGKTTLAKKVFNDENVSAEFEKRIWVCVSKPVNLTNIMKTILEELKVRDYAGDAVQATLLQKIKGALEKTTYLIIMDDVWGLEHGWWRQMLDGLNQDGIYNSCIIITTRNEEIAKSMGVENLRIHRPSLLDDEDSWSLLCKVAFSTGICRHPHLEDVGKNIAKKCDGLPLAVKAVGGLLSTKSNSLSEWQKIHDNFRDKLAEISSTSENSVIASLQLSYEDLPSRLKQCILCFSIYPEDHKIRSQQLMYWWAGEGFIVPGSSSSKTTLQVAQDYLSQLFRRCLIEPADDRSVFHDNFRFSHCKMHDMVRDLIIIVAKQEAFCSFDNDDRHIFDKDTRRFGIAKGVSIPSTQISNSKIRAMVLIDRYFDFKAWKEKITKVDNLRVLDLSHCDLQPVKEFAGWVKKQKRLAYLNLETTVSGGLPLPDIFNNLRNLQYLSITSTILSLGKNSVSGLRKLIVLDLSYCYNLRWPEEGLGNLINLEELSGLNLEHSCLKDLVNMPKLRVLRLNVGKPNPTSSNVPTLDADMFKGAMLVLSQLVNLQVLSITTNVIEADRLKQLDHLVPPPSLQELYIVISRLGETMPGFIKPELLPKLRYLSINSESLTHTTDDFWGAGDKRWNLEALSLIYLPKLQIKWETVRRMMPLIRCVEIKDVPNFESFPGRLLKDEYSVWKIIDEEEALLREEQAKQSTAY